jgi:hypothetical protein
MDGRFTASQPLVQNNPLSDPDVRIARHEF